MLTFSIVIPTFRRPHTLPRAVASVLAQTYPHWELIVVSGDAEYPNVPATPTPAGQRVHVVMHAEVAGADPARNRGLDYATGDLVYFFDDDDEMLPDCLGRFAATFAAHPDAGLVRAGVRVMPSPLLPQLKQPLDMNGPFATPCVALRREYATPTWVDEYGNDQRYFRRIFTANGWTRENGGMVYIPDVLSLMYHDPTGGLRTGGEW